MTNITEEIKKGACLCNKCGRVFKSSEIKRIHTERNGQQVIDSVCPYEGCNSNTYGVIDYPVTEEKLIYKSNFPSELKIHMDQIVEDILEQDRNLISAAII